MKPGILIIIAFSSAVLAAQEKQLTEADFTSAQQCGVCHQEIYEQWSNSMHARSATDSLYRYVASQAIEQSEGRLKGFCLSCHLPVASVTGGLDDSAEPVKWDSFGPVAMQGVTCDFCHTASAEENLTQEIVPGFLVLRRTGSTAVKYGRHADASGAHHPVQPSKFLTSPQFCAACHSFKHPVAGIEVQNTYREWQQSPYAEQGIRCQDCHMPPYAGASAVGAAERPRLHAHVFKGGYSEMIRRAATVSVEGRMRGKRKRRRVEIEAAVTNSGAGHSIPTGLPGIREMWLEIEVFDSQGKLTARRQFPYGARLLKADGTMALPWEAYERRDNRLIPPGKTRKVRLEIPLTNTAQLPVRIRASLFMRRLPESLSNRLGLPVSIPSLMAREEARVED